MSNPSENDMYGSKMIDAAGVGSSTKGLLVSEMPSGNMRGTTSEATAPAKTEMPSGSEMPGGQMTGTGAGAAAGLETKDMPPGGMSEAGIGGSGLREIEMPSGQMADTKGGLTVTGMPSGNFAASGKSERETTSSLQTMEFTGEWRLTLSNISMKSSPGN